MVISRLWDDFADRTHLAASHYCSTIYERAGPPWDTRCTPLVQTDYVACICVRASVRVTNEAVVRTRSHGGLTAG